MRFCILLLLSGWLFAGISSYGQVRTDSLRLSRPKGTLDSLHKRTQDSLRRDTTILKNQTNLPREVETTVKHSTKDSIVLDMTSKVAHLYKEAQINYGDISLNAQEITIDWNTGLMSATGVKDTTGKVVGSPIFTEGGKKYETERIRYNLKSRRANIEGVVTVEGEGFIHGKQVFKDPEDNLYIRGAIYTTCNLKEPHFHIFARKLKIVDSKQIVSGPFNFYLNNIPLPVGLPFGFFPYSAEKRKSGIIVPQYGEEPQSRGFFLRQGGYYWAASEYFDISFLGEIYSRGGWGINTRSSYSKKYAYSGSVDLRFNRQLTGDEGFRARTDAFWVSWSHSPFSRGTGRFSASVNAGTTNYNSRFVVPSSGLQTDINRRISPTFNSNVSYSNVVRGLPINYSLSARHDMNTATGIMNLALPEFNMSVNRLYPFKGRSGGSKYFWQTLNLAYQVDGFNRLSNSPENFNTTIQGFPIANVYQTQGDTVAFNFNNASLLWKRAEKGIRHSIPVSMSMKLMKYFSLNYGLNYQETWYPQKLTFRTKTGELISASTPFSVKDSIVVDTARGLYRSYSYSASASLTTNIYGTFYIRGKRLDAIRHRMVPSVGYSIQPSFARNSLGFYQTIAVYDTITGGYRTENIARFASTNGLPSTTRSGSITFSLTNNFEAKLKSKSDTAKNKFEKVSLLDNLSLSTSYNMAADSFQLAPISIAARTRLFKKVDFNFTSTLDPYKTVEFIRTVEIQNPDPTKPPTFQQVILARRVSEYAWKKSNRFNTGSDISRISGVNLGQITNMNISLSTSLNPKAQEKTKQKVDANKKLDEATKNQIKANPDLYVDFDIPWNLNLSYNFNYIKSGFNPSQVIQTLTFNGEVKVTDKWRVGFNSGYDFEQKNIVNTTQFNIYRDLHCWDMAISWSPFGIYQFYSFDLKVKSTILQDLKISRRGGASRSGVF